VAKLLRFHTKMRAKMEVREESGYNVEMSRTQVTTNVVIRASATAEPRSPSINYMAGPRNSGYSEDYHNYERPLVVKCTFYDKKRRITFNAAKNCSCDILRQKVRDHCLS